MYDVYHDESHNIYERNVFDLIILILRLDCRYFKDNHLSPPLAPTQWAPHRQFVWSVWHLLENWLNGDHYPGGTFVAAMLNLLRSDSLGNYHFGGCDNVYYSNGKQLIFVYVP